MIRQTLKYVLPVVLVAGIIAETAAQRGRGRSTTNEAATQPGQNDSEQDEAEDSSRGRGGRFGRGQSDGEGAGGRFGRFGGGASTDKLFSAIDVNDDGVITRAEMANAMIAFAKLDKDKDDKLTKEEAGSVRSGFGMGRGRGGFGEGQAAADESQSTGRGRSRGGFVRGRSASEDSGEESQAAPAESKPVDKPRTSETSKSPFDD